MNKWMMALGVAILAGSAHAQSYKQFHDELFCQDQGYYAYQSLLDFHNNVAADASLQRVDGYLCTDRLKEVCEIKRDMLRKTVRLSYRIGSDLHVSQMSQSQFLQFNDANRTQAISACMEVARSR